MGSLSKIGYHRRSQSIISSILPGGLRSVACMDAMHRPFIHANNFGTPAALAKARKDLAITHTHVHLLAAFSRSSNGLTRARGKSAQLDWI